MFARDEEALARVAWTALLELGKDGMKDVINRVIVTANSGHVFTDRTGHPCSCCGDGTVYEACRVFQDPQGPMPAPDDPTYQLALTYARRVTARGLP